MRRLRFAFETAAALAAEFDRNISKGGVQIRTSERPELREQVEVEFTFAWRADTLVFEAEVVFCSPSGSVAVQFVKAASELRADLEPFLAREGQRQPTTSSAAPTLFGDLELDPEPGRGDSLELGESIDFGSVPRLTRAPNPRAKTVARVAKAPAPPPARDPLGEIDDRRKSPRAAARVPARVHTTHVNLEGRTRDLSETGVLISADGSDLPLGKPIELELQHPVSGERIAVRGKVARHIQTEGTVAAVGITFDTPAERSSELREFVRDVKRAEAERAAAGITGRVEELGMASLIQMLGQSSPHGTLTANLGSEEATIAFENGAIRYALLGSLRGEKALARILQWNSGTFSFHAQVDAMSNESAPLPLQSALLEAARQLDETAISAPLDLRARFSLEREALARAGELSKLEEAVLDLAGAGLTVRRMIDVIPDSDADVQSAIRSLLESGVLVQRE
jgi:Tfp pilus assembly protein PilZ